MHQRFLEIKTGTYGKKSHQMEEITCGVLTQPHSSLNEVDGLVFYLAGFEQPGTTQEKVKHLASSLAQKNLALFRYDYPGLGISEGNFENMTVSRLVANFRRVVDFVKHEVQTDNFHVAAHSLGACVFAESLQSADVKELLQNGRAVLIAPALNQGGLHRYWHAQKTNPEAKVTWENFKYLIDDKDYRKSMLHPSIREVRAHAINNSYFSEVMDKDYTSFITASNVPILWIHGSEDNVVPLQSVKIPYPQIIVKNGDHDLEKPSYRTWVEAAAEFFQDLPPTYYAH